MKKLFVLLGMLLLMCFGASALTVTVTTPASGAAISGTYNFSATISAFSDNATIGNCTFATTADGVFGKSRLGNITLYWNNTNTALLTETASTTITVSCYNLSNNVLLASGTSTGVKIDNTAPTCSQGVDFDNLEVLNPLTVDCSDSTDTTDLTYSITICTAEASCTTETPSDGIAIFEGSETGGLGDAQVQCTVTDEVSKSTGCTNNTIFIHSEDGEDGGSVIIKPSTSKKNDKNVILVVIIISIVALAVLITAYSLSAKKSKKRR